MAPLPDPGVAGPQAGVPRRVNPETDPSSASRPASSRAIPDRCEIPGPRGENKRPAMESSWPVAPLALRHPRCPVQGRRVIASIFDCPRRPPGRPTDQRSRLLGARNRNDRPWIVMAGRTTRSSPPKVPGSGSACHRVHIRLFVPVNLALAPCRTCLLV